MNRAERQRKFEEAEFVKLREVAQRKPLEELAVRQDAEMRTLLQKCHGRRVAIRRERDAAFEVYKQKYRNLEADQAHAHALEYSLPAEIGEVQSHKSRSTMGSTFRGCARARRQLTARAHSTHAQQRRRTAVLTAHTWPPVHPPERTAVSAPCPQRAAPSPAAARAARRTLKYESLAGTKFDVSDVSRLPVQPEAQSWRKPRVPPAPPPAAALVDEY